jgi:hypothetical protein
MSDMETYRKPDTWECELPPFALQSSARKRMVVAYAFFRLTVSCVEKRDRYARNGFFSLRILPIRKSGNVYL